MHRNSFFKTPLSKMWFFGVTLLCALLLPVAAGHSLFTCEPIMVPRCMGMSYNMTFFPSPLEHYDQAIAATRMEPFFPLMNLQCSPDVSKFLCMAFVPECTEPKHVVLPCRAMCETVYSDCKNLIDTFDIAWPSQLECDKLEDCTVPRTLDKEQSTNIPAGEIQKDYGFWCPRQLKTFQVTGYKFLGVNHCAPPCPNMYFSKEDLDFAKNFIGIISIICLCATLFTFLTFLIDVKRFRYPERPIIFYSVCYSIVSLIYFIGFAMGNSVSCNEAHEDFADADTVVLGSQNKACTVIFMVLYFCTMAGTIWWVMLTITWYLAAGQKWSCEAIEQKAMWFHTVAWGIPGILTIILLAMNKVEGDNISGVCFVGLYDQNVSMYFVLLPLCFSVFIGLSLLLAGIISLNNVRQVIQHDERNQEKLKKFMIRIGVFSGTYLVPLGILLCCNVYELLSRSTWEMTWVADHCQEYHIPCPYQPKNLSRPDLGLFLTKYVMTLIVGISAIFWVGSKKTCSEWANFFHRNQKQDPVAESRRVLHESCEYFTKHNSKPKHKKHHRSSSHKLKVLSKSMGTSTSAKANHGVSAMTITSHDFLDKETVVDLQSTRAQSPNEDQESASSIQKTRTEAPAEVTTQTLLDNSELPVQHMEQNNHLSVGKGNGVTGSIPKKIEGSLLIENHLSDPALYPDSGSPPSPPSMSPTNAHALLLINEEREPRNGTETA